MEQTLVISVAASVPTSYIEQRPWRKKFPPRWIRADGPNTPSGRWGLREMTRAFAAALTQSAEHPRKWRVPCSTPFGRTVVG